MDNQYGFIELHLGPMRSGKSTALYAAGRRALATPQRVIVIGHSTNTRDTAIGLETRDGHLLPKGDRVDYTVVSKIRDDSHLATLVENAAVVLVEEGQFFSADDLTTACLEWRRQHKRVHISALSGDFCRKPWATVTQLTAIADTIHHYKGVCQYCYRDASFTCAIVELNPGVPHPDDTAYRTVCDSCYAKHAVLPTAA